MNKDNNTDKIVNNLIGKDFKVSTVGKPAKKYKPNYSARAGILLAFIGGAGFFYGGLSYQKWRQTHEWQFPITMEYVGFVREIKPNTSNTQGQVQAQTVEPKTNEEILSSYKLAPILKSIYFLESTSGKNDGCKDQGKFNGFGYAQNTRTFRCFDSFELVVDRVNEWFTDRLAGNGNNIVEAVCFYNTGIQGQRACDYSENFASVIVDNL